MNRRGTSLVELLVVVLLLGILANIAVPVYLDARRKADAAAVVGAVHTIRVAALDQYAVRNRYPASEDWQIIPAELRPSLPGAFVFRVGDVQLRWQVWPGVTGGAGSVAAVEVRTDDPRLMWAIAQAWKRPLLAGGGRQAALLID